MTIDQIVALFASVGACASAVATCLTVREMAKQRTTSFRPELVISRVSITGSQQEGKGLPTEWEALSRDAAGTTTRGPATLAVSNVGLGAAKDLRFVSSFDVADAVETLNQLATQGSVSAEMRIDEIGALCFEAREIGMEAMWVDQQNEASDYLLPAFSHSDSFHLQIPRTYILAVAAFVYVWALSVPHHGFGKLPPLVVAVAYADIAGVQHNERFVIESNLQMVRGIGEQFAADLVPKRSA
jgi:hypothetical protein